MFRYLHYAIKQFTSPVLTVFNCFRSRPYSFRKRTLFHTLSLPRCSWWLQLSKRQQGSMFANLFTYTLSCHCALNPSQPSLLIPLLSVPHCSRPHISLTVTLSLNKCQPGVGGGETKKTKMMCKHHAHTHSSWGRVYHVVSELTKKTSRSHN